MFVIGSMNAADYRKILQDQLENYRRNNQNDEEQLEYLAAKDLPFCVWHYIAQVSMRAAHSLRWAEII